jgi:hypothetical protein
LDRQTDRSTERDNFTFFPGDDEEVSFVADEDDETRTIVKPQISVAASKY